MQKIYFSSPLLTFLVNLRLGECICSKRLACQVSMAKVINLS